MYSKNLRIILVDVLDCFLTQSQKKVVRRLSIRSCTIKKCFSKLKIFSNFFIYLVYERHFKVKEIYFKSDFYIEV